MNNQILSLLFFCLVFWGCDPIKYLVVENSNNQSSTLVINFTKADHYNFGWNSDQDDTVEVGKRINETWETLYLILGEKNTIEIKFVENHDYRKVYLDLGLGQWSINTLRSFSNVISSIQIIRNNSTELIDDKDEIYEFLITNKKDGLLHITI